jgi:hypothetical protein
MDDEAGCDDIEDYSREVRLHWEFSKQWAVSG